MIEGIMAIFYVIILMLTSAAVIKWLDGVFDKLASDVSERLERIENMLTKVLEEE